MVQIRPLRFLRCAGQDGIGRQPTLDDDGQLIYGRGAYLSADKCLIFGRSAVGKWNLSVTGILTQTYPDIIVKLNDSGIFHAQFDRRIDLIRAVEEVLSLDDVTVGKST